LAIASDSTWLLVLFVLWSLVAVQFEAFGGSQVQPGGGNFASPSQGTMNQYGAGGSGGGAAKKRDPQSLRRVTVKQLTEAQEIAGKYHIDNGATQLQQVALVANVLTMTMKETNIELTVEDGTGTIQVRMYLDGNESESSALAQIKEGEYRYIVGTLKKIGGALCVVAFTLSLVEDHNVVTMHLLDTILNHQRAVGAPKREGGAAAANGYAKQEHVGMQVDHVGNGHSSGAGSVRDQVLYEFQHGAGSDTDTGCSIGNVMAQLSKRMPALSFAEVQDAVAQLSNDGHLYSTVDEDHYKTTSS
jgi:replication factor A2